ncbi:MAG: aminodeoxychorismate lyase [Aquificae bacterium]|nr:aminodeoxychorismate lyase [Aquificota bacterium]
MEEVITVNGQILKSRKGIRTMMYGEGVFETFRYNGGLPDTIQEHYKRMEKGAELLQIPMVSYENFLSFINRTVKKLKTQDLYIKAVLLSEGNLPYPVIPLKSNLMVVAKPYKAPQKDKISLTLAPFKVHSTNPLLRIKTTNFMEKVLAKRYAISKGFDDALFLNERDEITETTSANIFWEKGKFLFTPAVECGLLEGITRKKVIQEAKEKGYIVVEGRFTLKDLMEADKVFITNSLNGIIKVANFDFLAQEEL